MQERTESQGFYEMLWDCDHCETKGLLAKSQRHCPECGAKQNPDKRYFPKEGEAQRVDGHRYEGADRACAACAAPQSARANNCTGCGAPLTGAAEVRGIAARMTAEPAAPPRKRRWWRPVLIVAVIGLVIFGIWYRFIRKHSATLTVTGHRWERVIPIEEYNDHREDGWRDLVPADARSVTCHKKERTTRQVADGEECHDEKQDKKDGTFEVVKKCKPKYRSEPVEDDWCSYHVLRWKELAGSALRAADVGQTPASPKGAPPANVPPTVGARRAGAERQTLTLDLGDQRCDVSEATWRKYKDGDRAKVEVRATSGAVVCDTL